MKVAILGFGREGRSVYEYISRNPAWKKAGVWILDENTGVKIPRGAKSRLGKNYLSGLQKFDCVFRSPGIPYLLPELQTALKKGVEISSATRLFFEEARSRGIKIIGVTGSKGKTTVCHILYSILKAAARKVFLAGNVGTPALSLLPKMDSKSWVVLEISSFQLQDMKISPSCAVVLDVFPEHQDAHKSVKEYYSAKANLVRHQKKGDITVFLSKNAASREIAGKGKGRKICPTQRTERMISSVLRLPGEHALRNAGAAATLARELKISWSTILSALGGFKGVEHRLELVRSIKLKNKKIDFYNDSAATNPQTTLAAVASFPETEVILLAGGHDKGLSYANWAKHLPKSKVARVVIYGENLAKIYHSLGSFRRAAILTPNLVTATELAYGLARVSEAESTAVLLSPGAASFDQFNNYAERGAVFKYLVKKLKARPRS